MRIGIIGAMDIEVTQLCEQLTDEEVSSKAGLEFHAGKLAGAEVVVVRSGIGKVNAALCTQALIDLYAPAFIVNTGIGGSLDSGISIGDIVVSANLVQHDVDVTELGYQLGEIPGCDDLGFPADERCVSAALEAARDLGFTATSGRIVSGDQFISSEDTKQRLASSFSGLCCEMEGAAIAQVATANDIPFVVIRTISDNGDPTQYADFGEYAATRSAQLTERMVAILSE
ncbi:MAG: 5'-methylthioadenosine/adenosylhomocysteine nucleosidase [Atopobiaceae bacterium]|nr:5'-methylthioadenosine/adenosylhomocysteine nucleosidase [Atopobiaceae bacterium]MBR3316098.1 5'-methylthioadenosine/adenosylhomocysteine nucleosidase [Atopobiaceae bacterium]